MNEGLKVTGRIKVEHIRNGQVISTMERDNVITTVGKNSLASLLNSASAGTSLVTHIGFGTSSTAVAATDTTLGTELTTGTYSGYARQAVTRSNPSGNVIRYVATLTGGTGNPTIQEVGLFNAATSGTLFAHQLTGAVNLASASDSLQITWDVTLN
jgi:hypothetical protein